MKVIDYILSIEIAAPRTIWWHNIDTFTNTREDHFISLTRVYSRDDKAYAYRLIIGRLSFVVANLKQ